MSLAELRARIRARQAALEQEEAQGPAAPSSCSPRSAERDGERGADPDCELEPASWAVERRQALASRYPEWHRRLEGLDARQLEAVLAGDEDTLVEAQVGSGKTTVLVHRALALHRQAGVPFAELCLLTFTQAAAEEIKQRLRALLGATQRGEGPGDQADPLAGALIGTFHSVARTLLKGPLPLQELGYPGGFRVLGEAQRQELWERLIARHRLNVKYRQRLGKRVAAYRAGRVLYGNMRRPDDLPRLLRLTDEAKRREGWLDFDDLIQHATRLLRDHPEVGRPSWLLIDEFQDTSSEQLAFAEALAGPHTRWFVVGDPHQTIYGWRGGRADVFRRFARRRPGAVARELVVNYRSTEAILASARACLRGRRGAHKVGGQAGALRGVRGRGGAVRVVDHYDTSAELAYLEQRIRRLGVEGVRPSEIAILVRTRRQAPLLRAGLTRAGIPCGEPTREGLAQAGAARWLQRLLLLGLAEPAPPAPERVLEVVAHPRYGRLSPRQARGWLNRRRGEQGTGDRGRGPAELEAWWARVGGLAGWIDEASPTFGSEAWVERLLEHLEVPLAMRPTSSSWKEDLDQARRWLGRWAEWAEAEGLGGLDPTIGEASPAQRLRRAVAAGERAGPSRVAERSAEGVTVTTLHGSKGLEWRWVFLSGLNEGRLPLATAWRDREILAEERRLFFVGLTRARDGLELSWHREPGRPDIRPEPSRFLADLPDEFVEQGPPPQSTPDTQAAAACGSSPHPDSGAAVGDRVRHRRYGEGTVLECGSSGLCVDFGARGQRRFATGLARLEVLA